MSFSRSWLELEISIPPKIRFLKKVFVVAKAMPCYRMSPFVHHISYNNRFQNYSIAIQLLSGRKIYELNMNSLEL